MEEHPRSVVWVLINITSLLYRATEKSVTVLPPMDQTSTDNASIRDHRTVRDLKISGTTTSIRQPEVMRMLGKVA